MRGQLLELAERHSPFEMVGLLGGTEDALLALAPAQNHSPTPRVAFYVEPDVEIGLHKALFEAGHSVVGVYHSHPRQEAKPSESDLKMCRPGWVMVIVSPSYEQVRAFEDDGTEIDLETVDRKPALVALEDLPDTLDGDDAL